MTKLKSDLRPKKGGKRKPAPLKTSQQRAIQVVIDLFKGPAALSRFLKVNRQLPLNWKTRGRVPIEDVGPIARALGFSPYLLNYKEVDSIFRSDFTWEGLVNKELTGKTSDSLIKFILAGTPPV